MNQTDYEAIARIIGEFSRTHDYTGERQANIADIVHSLADYFTQKAGCNCGKYYCSSPTFDRDRFIVQCYRGP